ncbi:MarR family transcriptional regulator [Tropicimonas sp. TH_r6]|uniref:MarR family winged helix-turn-helix transcriptional regulator n=1 Tax=Tropicimonas sp. TH_r6 TaxID=3082085 RepID=UPI0029547FA7|nr:MarR family transcriptional regulator [Tropicimonas sp. TH_r6]MDV7141638.1 MarR family transcriptional regulator [Tropicimonas sp. TH_r6]
MVVDISERPKMTKNGPAELSGLYLQVAARVAQRLNAAGLGDTAVQPPYLCVLILLQRYPGIRQGSCAELLGHDPTTFGRYVDRLVRDGYVHREVPATDRRAISLELTPAGAAVMTGCNPALAALDADARRRMGDADWEKLSELLERFLDVYDHPLPPLRRDGLASL